jgi:heme/copper-type cytochrome/quinol oxidase subunit 2
MSEELNKQLAELANKLGISVEHLWGVLIKQAYIDGISSLVTVVVCVLLVIGIIYAFLYFRRRFRNTAGQESPQPFGVLVDPFGFVIVGIVLLFIGALACDNFYWVISDFFNPEFYALRHLPLSK